MQALRNVVSSIAGGVRGAMTSLSAAQRQAAANAAKASMEENQAKITQSAAELIAHTSRFIPQTMAQASKEASVYVSNPLNWTVGQAVIGGSVAFELFAFFTIGEVLGRGQLIGYPVKPLPVPSAHH